MVPNFFYHPRMMEYDFGPKHPLKPVRLARTVSLLKQYVPELKLIDPGLASAADIQLVHSSEYVDFVESLNDNSDCHKSDLSRYGFGSIDTPAFQGIYNASLGYCGGTVRAAEAILSGGSRAFSIGGGLHHAQYERASGFCVFNDAAIAIKMLKKHYNRVLYVDIDLHHGDGVQNLFRNDMDICTFSIHESGHTLYPGSGFLSESDENDSIVNVPLSAGTTGDTWLWAFSEVFLLVLSHFQPQVIVLQMGCDAHKNDPLGHLKIRVQDFIAAVSLVNHSSIPILACGGGGYNLQNVPRMWAASVMTLSGVEFDDKVPTGIPGEWGLTTIFDHDEPAQTIGEYEAKQAVDYYKRKFS